MDARPLLHQSPPSQETSSSESVPAQYEPPPSQLTSSSPRSKNVSLPPPSPPLSSPRASSSPASASGTCEPRLPPSLLQSPSIKIEETSEDSHSNEVQTGGATANGNHTIIHEPAAQDRTLPLPRSTAATISAPTVPPAAVAPAVPPAALAGHRHATFWRFIRPTRNPTLPVTSPQPIRLSIFRRFRQWHESCQGHLLPNDVIQVRIAVCGFAFYGIMALLGNTWDLVKEFSENSKVLVLFLIGFIWTAATVTVPLTMSARSKVDQALSYHGTRLVLLGITLHMLFNLSLMLPRNIWTTIKMNLWSLVALVFLLVFAIIGHGVSWVQSSVYGEVEGKPTEAAGNNMASS